MTYAAATTTPMYAAPMLKESMINMKIITDEIPLTFYPEQAVV